MTVKSIDQIIKEDFSFRINRDTASKNIKYRFFPQNAVELKRIITKKYNELGPGTKKSPIDLNDIDVSQLNKLHIDMGDYLFSQSKFKYIDISEWDTSNIEDFRSIFYDCSSIVSVGDLGKWNVSNAKKINAMFTNCSKLSYIGDISSWQVDNVEWANTIFRNCKSLTYVGDLSNWNTSNMVYMQCMFYGCQKLTNVGDITKWKINKNANISEIFKFSGLTNIEKEYYKLYGIRCD